MHNITEQNVRQQLAREDLRLSKSRNGYMVLDWDTRAVVGGGSPIAYGLTLEQAAEYVDWYQQQ